MIREEVKKHILKFLRSEGILGIFINVYTKSFDYSFDRLFGYYGAKKNIYAQFFNDIDSFCEWDRTKQGWSFWSEISEKWKNYCGENHIFYIEGEEVILDS